MIDYFMTLFNYIIGSHTLLFIYIINFLLAIYIIFFEKKDPTKTMAWIMLIFVLPVIGIVIYLMLSQNIARRKIYKLSANEGDTLDFVIGYQMDEMSESDYTYPNEVARRWGHMIHMNQLYASSFLLTNNDVELITDGKEKFNRLIEDIENAKKSVCVCYFIIKDDEVGNKLIETLTKKAAEGVKVRLLMDAMGSKQIGYWDLREFKAAGGQYAFFFKPFIRHLFINFNYRNHRKLVVIDDEIGYIGGFNIAREYLGMKKKFGYWRDTHIRIRGDAVTALNNRFYLDWRVASKEKIDLIEATVPSDYARKRNKGTTPIQIVSCGPDSPKQEIKQSMMRMITYAKRNIYIQTPYLVPDKPMMDSLIMAAQSGIDVRIMIPCMPDHPFVYRTTLSNAGDLIAAGARIYIYDNGFLHAKTLVVDGEVSTVGSCNFDIRSFQLNFESNAFIYDKQFAAVMENQFREDMKLSHEYTRHDRAAISIWEKIAESVSRLLTEVL
jgi:cardiolipin synthase